jgi:hypothetical protein
MAAQEYRIVSAEESDIHDEPHIEGSRITVRDVYMRVAERGLPPERVADRFDQPMAYRLVLDENVEHEVCHRPENYGHDVEHVDSIPELGKEADDTSIARYSRETERR